MRSRSIVIAVLLTAILGFTVAAVLQGQGRELLGILVAILVFAVLGLLLMLRWTASMYFWGGIGQWLRRRRER
jgi:uncharacterized membrane protein